MLITVVATARCTAAAAPAETAQANRLIREKSPYLRQHALNPVDWYPWGDEAFAKARKENKPIFLSIGYSTCHWCHVMERESFSNPEIAAILNAHFVAIKVDREERPDVDRVYMTFVQASTGGGGWPLSVWLTPNLKPFYGGTYFPPENQGDHPGFKALLTRIAKAWTDQPEQLLHNSEEMMAALVADTRATASAEPLPIAPLRRRAFDETRKAFDAEHGGFESAPKFPQPALLEFLLDVHATSSDPAVRAQSLHMVTITLRAIAAGGIHDQLDGGFHRYSVDAQWHVPHFEKMLYDQAQLASVYLTAWQVTADPIFRETAETTLAYVRDHMMDTGGGFYSAEDADSLRPTDHADGTKTEGAFYVWSAGEIERVLGPKDAALFDFAYGVAPGGNAGEELAGRNVLFRAHPLAECAAKFQLTEDAARQTLAAAMPKLRAVRAQRPRPLRDDKIITAWNGLMISAWARAAQVLGNPSYADTASRAAAFVRTNLYDAKTGRLARSFRAGARDDRGFVEDYAFFIQGLLDLYEATFDIQWLQWANQLQEKQNELFLDPTAGGYFANAAGDASVILRLKEDNDAAEPSPNSIAVRNLVRLAEMLCREEWRELARQTARAFGPQLDRAPTALPALLAALGWLERSPQEILIHGQPDDPATARLVAEVWKRFLPNHVLLRVDAASRPFLAPRVPIVADLPEATGPATVYVCENFTCHLPTQDPAVLVKLLEHAK